MIRFEFEEKVDKFVASERQWLRTQRIAHYQLKLKQASTDDDKKFWSAVLKRNKD